MEGFKPLPFSRFEIIDDEPIKTKRIFDEE